MALAILTISLGAVSSALARTKSLSRSNMERARAIQAVESVVESMRAEDPKDVFVRFNADLLDNPPTGLSPGDHFTIPGLRPRPGDPDGFVGDILFPGGGVILREDVVDIELGMSRDLNSDGVIDSNNHATDYTILPVRIRAQWIGASGEQGVDIVYVVTTR